MFDAQKWRAKLKLSINTFFRLKQDLLQMYIQSRSFSFLTYTRVLSYN